jgi:hypothetical protein
MRATLHWAAPAVLFALAAGCGHQTDSATKAPTPTGDATPALASADLVTLHVEGMV